MMYQTDHHEQPASRRMFKTPSSLPRPPLPTKTRVSAGSAATNEEANRTLFRMPSL